MTLVNAPCIHEPPIDVVAMTISIAMRGILRDPCLTPTLNQWPVDRWFRLIQDTCRYSGWHHGEPCGPWCYS